MVMERPLSPQSVGREFVRQYYTLLNESPAHLYRFYNHNSSFIHCGIDPSNSPVVGQKEIHQQIQQLNFQDCRTKIKRVDSQATLGNGVVVQVFGKLSNAGQRMRKFTQTFVLAPQSPKKYYVHNDIFRYQDDDSDDEVSRSEVEEQEEEHPQPTEIRQTEEFHPQPQGGYFNAMNPVMNGNVEPKIEEPPMMMNQVPPAVIETHQVTPPSNINSMEMVQSPPMAPQEPIQPAPPPPSVLVNPPPQFIDEPPAKPQDTQEHQFHNQQPPSAPQHNHQFEMSNETTKTYAGLVKAGNNFIGPYYNNNSVPMHQSAPKLHSPPLVKNEFINNKNSYSRNSNEMSKNEPKPQRNPDQGSRNNFSSGPRTSMNNEDNGHIGGGNDTSRRRSYASDSHQLFIGNLPHTATEQELRELFEKFGQIQELKICNKGGKGGSGIRVPNYGFVVFEDKASASAALSSRPILLASENGVSATLNVEEKKRRSEGGGGGRGGPRGGMRGGLGGPPRGGRGGGSGMRFNNPNNINNHNNNVNNRR